MVRGKATGVIGRPRKRVREEPSFQNGTLHVDTVSEAFAQEIQHEMPSQHTTTVGTLASPPEPGMTPAQFQVYVKGGAVGEVHVNVRLLIDGSDADGIRAYDELLPVSLVHAILDPRIPDFFIPIAGTARTKPPRTKGHWFHTSYIREVLLFDELPEERA